MESKAQSRKRRILAVLAHPDDETFDGRTLALYASRRAPRPGPVKTAVRLAKWMHPLRKNFKVQLACVPRN